MEPAPAPENVSDAGITISFDMSHVPDGTHTVPPIPASIAAWKAAELSEAAVRAPKEVTRTLQAGEAVPVVVVVVPVVPVPVVVPVVDGGGVDGGGAELHAESNTAIARAAARSILMRKGVTGTYPAIRPYRRPMDSVCPTPASMSSA